MFNMEIPTFTYLMHGKQYNVFVTKRYQRNIYYRYRENGFIVTCPKLTTQKEIIRGLDKYANRLVSCFNCRNTHFNFEQDYFYLLGNAYSISSINCKNEEELSKYLKKKSMQVLTQMVREQEQIMGIKEPYKVAIRNTNAQFGSNSMKTHKLSFQLKLIYFSEEIIKSVVVHELAHDFYRNHQKEFYNVVYKYCPNYKEVQKKLKKGIHK